MNRRCSHDRPEADGGNSMSDGMAGSQGCVHGVDVRNRCERCEERRAPKSPKLTEAQRDLLVRIGAREPEWFYCASVDLSRAGPLHRKGLLRVDPTEYHRFRLTEAGRKAVRAPFEFCERCRGQSDVRNCPDCRGTGRK